LGGGIPGRNAPILQKIREEVSSLSVCFILWSGTPYIANCK